MEEDTVCRNTMKCRENVRSAKGGVGIPGILATPLRMLRGCHRFCRMVTMIVITIISMKIIVMMTRSSFLNANQIAFLAASLWRRPSEAETSPLSKFLMLSSAPDV